ncbi:T9SS type A sorting domain-containing protein [Hymenobacter sp. HMF4947]|uniref:T9SS type A sorting domain-containing protein n=1 Tax=Hymenobacter ginkgonis TaxID=2682976 RepID=A0A7K1TB79_9BACT|nr:choice-of-anchor I family protein [Hymenobacter ginkgonis]MVN75654.1 T9SS type A sorting domain-containing protein [Hymenobacter ginkgonis]
MHPYFSSFLPTALVVGFTLSAAHAQTISRPSATLTVAEQAGSLNIPLTIANAGAAASTVQVSLQALGTATAGQDFTFAAPQTITFPAGATGSQTLTIPILDDALAEEAEYFVLRLQNPTNATVAAGATDILVYIRDNDTPTPPAARNLALSLVQSYQNGTPFSGSTQINSAEIVSYDASTKRLYVANSVGGKLDILNLANPAAITAVASIDIKAYGGINSVAARNGLVACAIENATPQANGSVVFFDQNGVFQKQLTVGALPDMITFSPDGRYVLTANEGEPNAAYTADPEGSVSVIDVSGGVGSLTQANVTTAGFAAYNGQAAALRAQGIRIYGGLAGAPSTVAQDLEPEYVAVSADSQTAYITLQENNAIAVLDLATKQITALRPVGYSDHRQPGRSLDASDQTTDVLLANWPIKGMRQPDAIATFEVNGTAYLLTANEGDARDYAGFSEQVRLGTTSTSAPYVLDPTVFPNAALLKNNNVLGRLNVTNKLGDTDGDGDFDEIYAFGGRSFSIYTAATGAEVHDSGNLLERVTAADATYGSLFNASNGYGEAPVRKNRSDDKGPEPEGVTTGRIGANLYAFVSMERVGGVLVFNINNPASPVLETYVNNRSLTAGTGDLGPEGIVFIAAADSPTGQPLLLLANEVSSTVAVYSIQTATVTATRAGQVAPPLLAYPNPSQGSTVRLSRAVSGTLHDLTGRAVRQLVATDQVATTGLAAGLYVLRATDGATSKLVVR